MKRTVVILVLSGWFASLSGAQALQGGFGGACTVILKKEAKKPQQWDWEPGGPVPRVEGRPIVNEVDYYEISRFLQVTCGMKRPELSEEEKILLSAVEFYQKLCFAGAGLQRLGIIPGK